ncbi:MAG: FAD-dependent oxidoreductase [Planctomycetes bacterium]|nr:FAD-dependent oxidoreductase [Planctomycetota bacterium]
MHIAIVGAGVVGLTSGVRLRELGHAVTIFAERRTPETTSDRAAAAFTPPRGPLAERTLAWVRASCRAFEELARTTPESGVDLALFRELSTEPMHALPAWAADIQGFQRLTGLPPPHRDGWAAVLPRIDMTRYLPWLERRFEHELGGAFVSARLLDLGEPFDEGFELVVNASGLGARRLARDEAVVPIRGQVLHVPNVLHLDTVLCDESRGRPCTYVIPFPSHVVVGGTFEPDEWIEECDEPALASMLDRARELLAQSGVQHSERLGRQRLRALAGLRPGRKIGAQEDCVRLERVELAPGRPLVHAYGHGRAGVTLSWGCAEDVARLCTDGALGGAHEDPPPANHARARSA